MIVVSRVRASRVAIVDVYVDISRGRCRPPSTCRHVSFTSLLPGLSSYFRLLCAVHPTFGHQLSGTAEAGTETNDWLCFLTSFNFVVKRQPYKHTTPNQYMFIIHRYIHTSYTPGRHTSINSVILAMQWVAYVSLPVILKSTVIHIINHV